MLKSIKERWLPVEGFADRYEVSDKGRVRSLWTGKYLCFHISGQSKFKYRMASLWRDGKRIRIMVHRLVLVAFVGPHPVGMFGLHWNGNSLDNQVSNLRWGTAKENALDQERHGTRMRGVSHHQAKLTERQVRYIKHSKESCASLGRRFKISDVQAGRIRLGTNWRHL